MPQRLAGKVVIVVGAGTGIGAATARRLAQEGARVCLADVNESAARNVAADLVAAGGEGLAVPCDISSEASVAETIARCVGRFGGLDGAHVNAADMKAILLDADALETPLDLFDRTLSVNLRGHLLVTRAVIPHLLARGGGSIVYTSSDAAFAGEPTRVSYAVAKSGLNGLMRHVAARWGREGITANCVSPGFVVTAEMRAQGIAEGFEEEMISRTPHTRLGVPGDIAAMVAMLLSPDGRWINGQVYSVNGGILLR